MKKIISAILAIAILSTMAFSVTASAATTFTSTEDIKTVNYYDENGNQITINGMYYNSQKQPAFNAKCYYIDTNGDTVYVGGCRAYYYNANGELVAGNYYYDADGNAVACPRAYSGGCGYGTYCYDEQGNIANGAYYYDDFGNPVEPTVNQTPTRRGCGGGGCRR